MPRNVIHLISDDQTARSFPYMAYLASQPEGHWVLFPNYVWATPWCGPSRANMLSGQQSHTNLAVDNGDCDKLKDGSLLPTWLHDAGYRTCLIGKYLNEFPWSKPDHYIPPGWDEFYGQFDTNSAYDYTLNENAVTVAYGSDPEDYQPDVCFAKAVDFIERVRLDRPFFLHVGPVAPHEPVTPADRHDGMHDAEPVTLGGSWAEADVSDKPAFIQAIAAQVDQDAWKRKIRAEYDAVQCIDEGLQAMIEALDARGILDDTVIFYSSDNSVAYADHRWDSKIVPYDVCLRGPLYVRHPDAVQRTATELVSNLDLPATIMEIAGGTAWRRQHGRSIMPLLLNEAADPAWRTQQLVEFRDTALSVPSYWGLFETSAGAPYRKYVEWSTGTIELYDLVNDLAETTNLSADAGWDAEQARLASDLVTAKAAVGA